MSFLSLFYKNVERVFLTIRTGNGNYTDEFYDYLSGKVDHNKVN